MSNFDQVIVRYTNGIIRFRWLVLLVSLIAVGAAGFGMKNITFDKSYRVFFDDDNPQLQSFDALQSVYSRSDNILIVVEPEDGNVFSNETLAAVAEITDAAWTLPGNHRVDSLTNFQWTRADGDELVVTDLVEEPGNLTPQQLAQVRDVAMADPLLLNRIISSDGKTTGVNVQFTLDDADQTSTPRAVAAARELRADITARYPDLNLYLTGLISLNNAFEENSQRDIMSITPLMYGVLLLVMAFLLRSFSGTATSLAVILFSSVTALGIAGWLGFALTPPSATAPTMIMTLAVADAVHILVTLFSEMRAGRKKRDAIVEAMRINFVPVFITSLTTAIGFLSLNFSEARPFRDLGNISSIGIIAAFVFAVTFLPAIMAVLPVRVRQRQTDKSTAMDKLASFVIARRRPLLAAGAVVTLSLGALVPTNELDDRWVEYFAPSTGFRQDSDFAMENLTGIYLVEHSLGAGESSGITRPDYLKKIEEFRRWYEQQPGVMHVNSYSEIAQRLNKHLHGDDPAYYKITDNRELAAQYHLLYTLSLPRGLDLNNQVDVDESATRFSVTVGNISTTELRALAERAENWLRENAPPEMFSVASSPSVMFAHVSERNLKSMVVGSGLALALITVCLIFALGSFRFGMISIIPNVVPALMGFGIWAIWRGEIGLSLSVVTSMTLGIVVDDTVHFLSKYLRARREKNLDPHQAIHYAFNTVGTALWVTSIVLVIGFAILSQSAFRLNSWMGQLTAVTIAAALIADFFFLPPILLAFEKVFARIKKTKTTTETGAIAATN